jgi:endonuclease-3 related protein
MEIEKRLNIIYDNLNNHFGDLKWWPGDSPFEIIVGAILTQNTNWGNVEKAIQNLKSRGLLSIGELLEMEEFQIAELIKPAGYYNIKAKRLKHFLHFLSLEYRNSLGSMFSEEMWYLRDRLLGINGIGEETADSILLYAGERPIFVVDAYTRRILERHSLITEGFRYKDIQGLFMNNLSASVPFYNQYHALIVNAGKYFCRKSPLCKDCPLKGC